MKLIHLSDLHLGKSLHMFSMMDAQKDILEKILHKIDRIQPDAVLIAGDLYDRRIPPESAVDALDDFLYALTLRQTPNGQPLQVMMISGNHDSAERISFGSRIMSRSGIHISQVWQAGSVTPVILQDAFGPVNFYLLPFVTRFQVKGAFPDREIRTYTEALRAAIADMHVDPATRNVLLSHQFVTNAAMAGSEEIVGGLDNVDADVFDAFDYVALGHLHAPQWVQRESIRYCGSPLKYSFAETEQDKSLTIVELGEKGDVRVILEELTPAHDLTRLQGTFNDLLQPDDRSDYSNHREDYLEITLTDEFPPAGAAARLREVYPRLLHLCFSNSSIRSVNIPEGIPIDRTRPAIELLEEFYCLHHAERDGKPAQLSKEQRSYAEKTLAEIAENRLEVTDSSSKGDENP